MISISGEVWGQFWQNITRALVKVQSQHDFPTFDRSAAQARNLQRKIELHQSENLNLLQDKVKKD